MPKQETHTQTDTHDFSKNRRAHTHTCAHAHAHAQALERLLEVTGLSGNIWNREANHLV